MAQQTDTPIPSPRLGPNIVADTSFQRMIREACEKEVGRIVEEEAAGAKRRVEERVIKMKSELAQRVLNKLRISTEQAPEYGSVRMIVEF